MRGMTRSSTTEGRFYMDVLTKEGFRMHFAVPLLVGKALAKRAQRKGGVLGEP
jgi:hypothetical protein